MAKKVEVTKEFNIGKNVYKVGDKINFSESLAEKYNGNLKPQKATVKKEK